MLKKIWKKWTILKMSRKSILHNDNTKKLLKKLVKSNFLIINQKICFFFHFKLVCWYFRIHMNLKKNFTFLKIPFEKNLMLYRETVISNNCGQFLDGIRNLITKTSKIWNIFLNFEKNFRIVKKMQRIFMYSEKWLNSFEMKKRFYWTNFFYRFINNFSALLLCKLMFLTFAIWLIFSDFCCITKYWNYDWFKFLALGVCCMCKVFLKESWKSHGSLVQGLCALCSTLIRWVRMAGNMNSKKSKFKKFPAKNVREILFYPSLPHVIKHHIFITSLRPLEPHVINARPLIIMPKSDLQIGKNNTFLVNHQSFLF